MQNPDFSLKSISTLEFWSILYRNALIMIAIQGEPLFVVYIYILCTGCSVWTGVNCNGPSIYQAISLYQKQTVYYLVGMYLQSTIHPIIHMGHLVFSKPAAGLFTPHIIQIFSQISHCTMYQYTTWFGSYRVLFEKRCCEETSKDEKSGIFQVLTNHLTHVKTWRQFPPQKCMVENML